MAKIKKSDFDFNLGRKAGKHTFATDHMDRLFPSNIDRGYFGSWLSGFVDGEGCFRLSVSCGYNRFRACTSFQINLRADDVEALFLIQSYWQCGYVTHKKKGKLGEDTCFFHVDRKQDLVETVIPHFEKYPLLAKKKNDFSIWCQGVNLCVGVMKRPRLHRGGFKGGRLPAWNKEDVLEFEMLVAQMEDERKYRLPTVFMVSSSHYAQ